MSMESWFLSERILQKLKKKICRTHERKKAKPYTTAIKSQLMDSNRMKTKVGHWNRKETNNFDVRITHTCHFDRPSNKRMSRLLIGRYVLELKTMKNDRMLFGIAIVPCSPLFITYFCFNIGELVRMPKLYRLTPKRVFIMLAHICLSGMTQKTQHRNNDHLQMMYTLFYRKKQTNSIKTIWLSNDAGWQS